VLALQHERFCGSAVSFEREIKQNRFDFYRYLDFIAKGLFFGWQDFPCTHLIDQVFSPEIDQMRSLFIICQICADPLRHNHNDCAIIHVHPIRPTNELVRSVSNERTIGIDG
jgi:hypothetical protein